MGDWNISRKRYFGLPLPFYPCTCGHLNVVGSRAELEERATVGLDGLKELHRPWIDDVPIRCEQCGEEVRRVPEVGDAWLDAGIVPFSTLGWENPEWKPGGYATGSAEGVTGADLPDHAYWEEWFPADWVSEMREQIRLWFYSLSFMSVTLTGRSPYRRVLTYEKLLDETGREMHRSWGSAIAVDEALDRMGADVMRWQYCESPPHQNIKFGYGPAHEVRRRLLTLWNSVAFLVTYANIEGFRPRYGEEPGGGQPLDRWLVARTSEFVSAMEAAYERYWTPALTEEFESFVDDVSNWYIRRSRRRFYSFDEAAFQTLWYALVQAVRAVAPLMPFLADHLWRVLVSGPCEDAPDSVFLAGWPEPEAKDEALLEEVAQVRRVVELGRQARAAAGLKLRQPLPRLLFEGARLAQTHLDEIRDELRVKEVSVGFPDSRFRIKPNLPVLGPKLGGGLREFQEALARNDIEQLADDRFRVGAFEVASDEVIFEGLEPVDDSWAFAMEGRTRIALDTRLDDELLLEGRVLDLIHQLNLKRKEAGLALTDRIVVTLPASDAELLAHEEWIKNEVLATEIRVDGGSAEPQIALA
jgi:isoleucyl-tRNA synthetase